MKNNLFGECVAEFIGTFIMIFIGVGTVASLVAAGANITLWELALVWGAAITIAIFITGFVSGTHINPAVTIALAVWKGFDKKKIIPYIIAQFLGAFAAAAVVYGLYSNVITVYENSNNIIRASRSGWTTAGIFCTFPNANISILNAFMVELSITAFLMIAILAVTDEKNDGAPTGGIQALAIGLTVAIIGASFGKLTGFAMNPARDFGPRMLCLLIGWGKDVLGPNNYGLIVPIFATVIGAILGGGIYEKLIVPYFPNMIHTGKSKEEVV